jgi:hypothetical protein
MTALPTGRFERKGFMVVGIKWRWCGKAMA